MASMEKDPKVNFFSSDLHQIHNISVLVAFLQHFCHQIKSLLRLKSLARVEALQKR